MSQNRKETLQPLLNAVKGWARSDSKIAAVALVGSHARASARPDSDVDLVVLTELPETFVADTSWARQFGRVQRETLEQWGRVRSVRVWYENSGEVEFCFATPDWAALPLDPGTRRVVEAGLRPLFDRTGILKAVSGM